MTFRKLYHLFLRLIAREIQSIGLNWPRNKKWCLRVRFNNDKGKLKIEFDRNVYN